MTDKIVYCDFPDCSNSGLASEMCSESDGSQTWYACPECEDKVEDHTGYCPVSCIFGNGCDESC